MTIDETQFWKRVADDLDIRVEAPYEVRFSNGTSLQVDALVRDFGAERGMLVSNDPAVLRLYAALIRDEGYGYSSNVRGEPLGYDLDGVTEMLKDWGWTGPDEERPCWVD